MPTLEQRRRDFQRRRKTQHNLTCWIDRETMQELRSHRSRKFTYSDILREAIEWWLENQSSTPGKGIKEDHRLRETYL